MSETITTPMLILRAGNERAGDLLRWMLPAGLL